MQMGTLGALAARGAALLAQYRELAGRLLAGGPGTWLCTSWSNSRSAGAVSGTQSPLIPGRSRRAGSD